MTFPRSVSVVADAQPVSDRRYDYRQVLPASVEYPQLQLILELMTEQRAVRFQLDEGHTMFPNLRERQLLPRRGNFVQTVLDLMQHAPRAAINRGADGLSSRPAQIQAYANQSMFDHENCWILWWNRQPH